MGKKKTIAKPEIIEPEILPECVDVFSSAVSEGVGSESFDVARKLTSLAYCLCQDVFSPEASAATADGAMFAKSMAHKVGEGSVTEEAAADAIVDRKTSAFVSATRKLIAEAVESGFETIGVAIGSAFGAPTIGYAVGSAVGHFLNAPVGELVERGASRIVHYATQAWHSVTNAAASVVSKISNLLFG